MNLVDVFNHIDSNINSIKNKLRDLISIPSIAITNENIDKAVSKVDSLMQKIGLSTEIIEIKESCPLICGEIKSSKSKKTILFYDHYDVQPADNPKKWKTQPFQLTERIENNKTILYGRGVSDNKGDLISRLSVIESFLNKTGDVPVNIKFFVEGEEEAGSPNFKKYIEKCNNFLKADAGIWEFGEHTPEIVPIIYCGMKGNQYVELNLKTAKTQIHSSFAPIIHNPVLRLNQALATLVDENGKILLDNFNEKIKPPTKEDLEQIQKIPFDENIAKEKWGVQNFKQTDGKTILETLKFSPSLTICGYRSGYINEGSKTIIPEEAMVKLDFRLVPDQTPSEIMDKLRKHLITRNYQDIEVIDLEGLYPVRTPVTDPFVKLVAESAQNVYKKEPIIDPISQASGPLYPLKKAMKCPFVSIGVGHTFSNKHAPNENITLEGFIKGMKFIATILNNFSN
ncbi:MAG: M20/M25/M40 family metallo-hydrolase [Candidatus Ranarchaeia archaeon]